MQFRKDINGLRAIAVIAVVLFHFNAAWMPGGFAGVDVFFVISGFLMTGIIFSGIEQEKFSILRFYVSRANRIIPALAVLCFVVLAFGWFFLPPLEYKALGKHVGSSMGFVSNLIYWSESGYFDAASHQKWLLHTWSLSVEWQFYIIYPLILVAMRKLLSVNAMKVAVLIGTLVAFIFCIIATYKWPSYSYYLLPARVWEMMIGGVAYLYPIKLQEKRKKQLEFFGILLICGSYFLVTQDSPWPGYLALFPVLGAFLLIQAQRNNSIITSNIAFQKIGTWSYSIYLWHWPIVVAIYYFSLNEVFLLVGIALSVILGFLSNKYIEKINFANNYSHLLGYLKWKPMHMFLVVSVAGSFVYAYAFNYSGVPDDIKTRNSLVNEEKKIRLTKTRAGICQFNLRGNYDELGDFVKNWDCKSNDEGLVDGKVLIFGDSHSADKAMGFRANGIDVIQIGGSNCPLNRHMAERRNNHCSKLFNILDQKVSDEEYDYVLLSSIFGNGDLNEPRYLENVINLWSKKDKQIIIFSPMPEFEGQLNEYLRFGKMSKQPTLIAHNKFFQLLNDVQIPDNVHIINTFNLMCENSMPCKVKNEKDMLMIDGGHLSLLGSRYFIESFLKQFSINNKLDIANT